jgi:hypothetical protein
VTSDFAQRFGRVDLTQRNGREPYLRWSALNVRCVARVRRKAAAALNDSPSAATHETHGAPSRRVMTLTPDPEPITARLVNVFTSPEHRRHGLARRLVLKPWWRFASAAPTASRPLRPTQREACTHLSDSSSAPASFRCCVPERRSFWTESCPHHAAFSTTYSRPAGATWPRRLRGALLASELLRGLCRRFGPPARSR